MRASHQAARIKATDLIIDDVVTTNDVTAVTVTLDSYAIGGPITRSGVAKKDPTDRYDAEAGIHLALGRALEAVGHALIKRGNGLVKHTDDIRAARAALAARPVAKTTVKPAKPVVNKIATHL